MPATDVVVIGGGCTGSSTAFWLASRYRQRVTLLERRTVGSGVRRLTALPGINLLPVWSPDSRGMAFLSNRDGEMAVYVMRPDGSGQRRLAPVYTDLSALPLVAWRPPAVKPR